jgi:hypothetical protein
LPLLQEKQKMVKEKKFSDGMNNNSDKVYAGEKFFRE